MKYPTDQYFPCYSTRIYEHLRERGFETYKDEENNFTGKFINIKTGKTCHVFKLSPELSACIEEVSKPK